MAAFKQLEAERGEPPSGRAEKGNKFSREGGIGGGSKGVLEDDGSRLPGSEDPCDVEGND